MMANFGLSFTPLQIGRTKSIQAYKKNSQWKRYTLPDVTIWTAPGQHHEIKHKKPTIRGYFGLEEYRFEALLWFANETLQSVYYTIHNHDLSGGRNSKINDVSHWISANVLDLKNRYVEKRKGFSWINGNKAETWILYWPQKLWNPLLAIVD